MNNPRFWYCKDRLDIRYWWVSMTIYGWDGGRHIVDDFGNLVPV